MSLIGIEFKVARPELRGHYFYPLRYRDNPKLVVLNVDLQSKKKTNDLLCYFVWNWVNVSMNYTQKLY